MPESNKFKVFHENYNWVNLKVISIKSNLNYSLVRQYATGVKTPSEKQLFKLQKSINNLGSELLNTNF